MARIQQKIEYGNDAEAARYASEPERHFEVSRAEVQAADATRTAQADLQDIAKADLQRLGRPQMSARRLSDSAYTDRVSRFGQRGAVVLGTALLLVYFLLFQFWLPAPLLEILALGWVRYPVLLCYLPITLFLLLALVGKRAHAAFFAACGALCLMMVGIDSGTHWAMSSSFGPIPKTFRTADAELPVEPVSKAGEALLAQGVQVYAARQPNVPPRLRFGERFIVPGSPQQFDYRFDEAALFRQPPAKRAVSAVYERYRTSSSARGISEPAVRALFAAGKQEDHDMRRLEDAQPYRTVATAGEAATAWRRDGPVLQQKIQKEKQRRKELTREGMGTLAVPVFSFEAALMRSLYFCWMPLVVLLGELVLARWGRLLWRWARNRSNRRAQAA